MPTNTILVVGGNGIIGRNAVEYLLSTGSWNTLVTSASALDYATRARYVQLDLLDPEAVAKQAAQLSEVTHVLYAAYIEGKTLAAQTQVNLALLRNLVTGLEQIAPNFRHLTFIQGARRTVLTSAATKRPPSKPTHAIFHPISTIARRIFCGSSRWARRGDGRPCAPILW